MTLKIKNSTSFKMLILSIALIINFCSSLYLMSSSSWFNDLISNLSLCISLFITFIYIYFNRKKKNIVIWILVYIVIFFAYRICKRREVLDLYIMTSYLYGEDYKKITRTIFNTSLGFVALVIILNILHILPTSPDFFRGDIIRFTFGFIHPNSIGHFAILIAECLFIIDYKKKSKETLIKLLLLTIVPFIIANCRSAFFINSLLTLLYLFDILGVNFIKNVFKNRFIRLMLPFTIVVVILVLLYVSENWNLFQDLNVLLNSRIKNNFLFLQLYGVKLFGNPNIDGWISVYDNWGKVYLDSGYLQLILCLGLVNTIIYVLQYFKAVLSNAKQKNYEIIVVLLIVSLMLVIETSPLRWYFSFVLLFITNRGIVFNNKRKEINN